MLKTVSSITNAIGALNYKGTWNANTNTPSLASGVGTKGDYYVVSVAGSTTLDGVSVWGVGDWATFNGSVWQRVEGGSDLEGVNVNYSGTLTGGTGVVNIGSNQFYKDASGNIGQGLQPSAWGAGWTAFENIGGAAVTNATSNYRLLQNCYFDGSNYIHKNTGTAIRYELGSGRVRFFNAVSASAGATATFVERVRFGENGEAFFSGVGTTASAANAFLDNTTTPANSLLRSTSSIRYKTNVETLKTEFADKVFELRPVWYRSKADADKKEWSWFGLIAEEVAQVEPRLVHWSYPESAYDKVAVQNDEGETEVVKQLKPDAELVPDGVQYERLSVLLLDVVKRQQDQISQLRKEFEEYKSSH